MAQQKSFTLDGKSYKLPPEVPAGEISWYVARFHVSESDDDVKAKVSELVKKWPKASQRRAAALYALACHRRNQKLFTHFRF